MTAWLRRHHALNAAALGIAAVSCFSASALAAEEFESHHAHEHGVAALNVAIEGKRVDIGIDTPAINVIGFEHQPRTAAEQAAVKKADAALHDVTRLFVFTPAAACHSTRMQVHSPQWPSTSEHADYEASYSFDCDKPDALTSIDMPLVNEMAAGTKLRVQLTSATKQDAAELTRGNSTLHLR